jgi:nucleoside 2-deoxyribosyltransferase
VENKYSAKKIMEHCFDEMKKCDYYIAFVNDIFGGGMAIECGYAYCLGLKIIACVPNSSESFTSLKGICDFLIVYNDTKELLDKLNVLWE